MPGDLRFPTAALLGFVVTLARVAGIFVFVPLPGLKTGFEAARVVLSFTVTLALFPYWPSPSVADPMGMLLVWIISEAALGIGIGLAVAFVMESFAVATQVMGLQAGYAFASTIDPNTNADSGVLVIFSQLAVGLIFLATGLDREVLRVFAASLISTPAGSFTLSRTAAEHLLSAASVMFSTGVRLALPIVAVLVMIDVSLALLGRINAQLQLLTVAFPIKMLVALTMLGWTVLLWPSIMRNDLSTTMTAAKGLFAR
jgi:flagellar biosynthesis protein FliR